MTQTIARFALLLCLASIAIGQAESEPRRIEIVAKRFEFVPSEITLQKGKPVTLVLMSEDVTHGLAIKEFNVKTKIKNGEAAEVTFVPDKTGDFMGKCSYFCGRGHGKMDFQVHVR